VAPKILLVVNRKIARRQGGAEAILLLATKAEKPLGESGFPVDRINLVAGTRNHLEMLFEAAA
jgi:hypothetical protein